MIHAAAGLERYEIGETVARSPRTTVRRARRKSDGCRVVLKSLTRDYPSRHEIGQLEFEYRILRKLALPGTVQAWDLERDGDRRVMVLEDFGGEALRPGGGGDLARFFAVALPLARTVGQVHDRGVIHKDIKPGNVLVNPATGDVKLIDFNIASELASEHRDMSLAAPLEGSLPYISPEQTGRMNRDLDHRTDYYSLGVTFFELLTGALPFKADDTMGWVHCHLSRAAPDVRDLDPALPEALALIVRKLMAKDPGQRYQSAHGLVADLETCRSGWAAGGGIEPFELGRRDVPERFQVSPRLFGREEELAALQEALGTASQSAGALMLVAGYSGVGKSSLINELQRSIVSRRGRFIAGKLDQLERNVPFGPVVQALRALVRQLLAEPEARLDGWRRELGAALGSEGRVLTDLIPELEQVIGPQPKVAELNPREAHERLQRVFRGLVRGMAGPDRPLVMFIDDLQWTDASTPELLVSLLGADPVPHLLVIGAYRDNEVSDGHLLAVALRRLEAERPAAVRRLRLPPLDEESVNRLIAETLRCDPAASAPLARLVSEKTGGNPFFVNELLAMLHRQGAFRFLPDEGRWSWDRERVEAAAVTNNVLELMLARLRSLPPETVEHLRWAACLGAELELATLARLADQPAVAVAAALMHAVEARILVPLGGDYRLVADTEGAGGAAPLAVRYRFQHDRVQQAAYSLLDEGERAGAHLKIGRLLRRAPGGDREDDSVDRTIFEVVNHLNLGRALMADPAERLDLARLDHAAGLRAKRATAYAIAASYFQASLDLRGGDETGPAAREAFETRRELALCLFLAGEVERAFVMCEGLAARAPDRRSRAQAYGLRALILEYQARMPEVIETLRQALAELGVELPREPAEIDRRIGEGIGTMLAHLGRVPIARIPELPEMADVEKLLVMGLLSRLVVAAIQVYPPLFVLTELIMFDLALTHGVTEVSCKNFVDCGIVLGGMLGDSERAYALARAAFALMKRYEPSALAAGVHFVFGGNVSAWRAPLREAFEELAEAQRLAVRTGDVPHRMFALLFEQALAFTAGRDLDECRTRCLGAVGQMQKAGAVGHVAWAETVTCAIARLQGSEQKGAAAEGNGATEASSPEALADRLRAMGNGPALFMHGQRQALVCLLLGEPEEGERWEALAEQTAMAGAGLQEMPLLVLCRALRRADRCSEAPPDERAGLRAAVQGDADKLGGWAAGCPENFAHKHLFLLAELARLDGAPADQVTELYGQAVRAAGIDHAHVRALAHERQASYWEGKRQPRIARVFFEEAYYTYERWGARAKLRQMERLRPEWVGPAFQHGSGRLTSPAASRSTLASRTSADLGPGLDIASVVKATQALSGEVKPERLYARLMSTIIENAGAQRGCLVLRDGPGGDLRVEARADVTAPAAAAPTEVSAPMSIDACAQLCPEVVRYVARTLEPVVIDDAAVDRVHPTAAYADRSGARSILCVPVLQRGTLVAVLYAENGATTHAFTPARVSLLQVIASQAAISITNARLYETLEDKVAERTRALAEKNQEVLAMFHGMHQGVFTIDEALRIQPGYSPHLARLLGTDDLAGRDCLPLLFAGSSVGPDAIVATEAALATSIGGPAFLAETNSSNLVRELERTSRGGERQFWELEWTPIVAEGAGPGEDAVVQRFLVVVRDVTLMRQLSRTAAENARQLDMVGQILDAGVDAFRDFARSSRAALERALGRLRGGGPLTAGDLAEPARDLHTLKGNARMLGLSHLVDAVHRAEDAYHELREGPHDEGFRARLVAGTESVLADLGRYEDLFAAKLGDLGGRSDGGPAASLAEIRALSDRLASGGIDAAGFAAAVSAVAARSAAVPLEALVRECARMLPSLAAEAGKSAPAVACDGGEARLAPGWARVFKDVLVHALRNAVDHGLEAPDQRRRAGKPEHGRITVAVSAGDGRAAAPATIRVRDDGRGLRLERLRAQAGGGPATDEEIAERVFRPGVSTAERVSALSGRGVGMDAIRSFVRAQGGDARVELTGPARDGCRPFDLVLELPPGAFVG